jgi:hypothetical protein
MVSGTHTGTEVVMDIFHVKRTTPVGHNSIGEMIECVVVAVSDTHARQIASFDHRDEGSDAWFLDSTHVVRMGTAAPELTEARVFCTDIHDG